MNKIEIISKNLPTEKSIKLLAKSMYKELIKNGFSTIDIINFSKEVIDNIKLSHEEYSEQKSKALLGSQ